MMVGPGFLLGSDRPFHYVSDITETRFAVGVIDVVVLFVVIIVIVVAEFLLPFVTDAYCCGCVCHYHVVQQIYFCT